MTYKTLLNTLVNNFCHERVRCTSWVTKRLGALSMPTDIPPYSSDRVAWGETVGQPGCAMEVLFPASLMKYSIAMGSGWFIDWQPAGPGGLGVCIEITVGSQWIFFSYSCSVMMAGNFGADKHVGETEDDQILGNILLVAGSKV